VLGDDAGGDGSGEFECAGRFVAHVLSPGAHLEAPQES
jgi:hypothetical protein